ncbi:MAG: sensor histidine kinase [Chloroflexota bacterium]
MLDGNKMRYTRKMKTFYEPGIIRVFQFFTLLQVVVGFLNVLIGIQVNPNPRLYSAVHAFALLILFFGLCSGWLRRTLGKIFLPTMLILFIIEPLVSRIAVNYASIYLQISTELNERVLSQIAVSTITLLIPLIITAWQYSMNAVFLYCTSISALFIALYRLFETQHHDNTILLQLIVFQFVTYMIVGVLINQLMREQRHQKQMLQQANENLLDYAATLEKLGIVRERNRLARELHDTLAHTQSAVIIQMEGIEALWEKNPQRAHKMFQQSLQAMRTGLQETRRALEALRATSLEDMGLRIALRNLLQSVEERASFELSYQLADDLENLPVSIENAVFRVIQEALTNVIRHAQATSVDVKLENKAGVLKLSVDDNGIGFSVDQVETQQHFGISGMREHAREIQADFVLKSSPGSGTAIVLCVGVDR